MPTNAHECQQKHEALVQYMYTHDLDAVVLTRRCNFAWFTGGGLNHVATGTDVGAASLIVTRERVICITNNIEGPRLAGEELAEVGIEVRVWPWHEPGKAAGLWQEALANLRSACDTRVSGMPDTVTALKSDFNTLRWALTTTEIERLRSLCRETATVTEQACRQARRQMTEHALAGRIAGGLVERGIRAPVVLIAADERVGSYRHPIPTGTRFEKYGMATVGAERDGVMAACTRLFAFGPIGSDLRRRHEAVCNIAAAMMGNTRPGRTLGEIFAIAQHAYADNGYPEEWKRHHQGGPTGYLAREDKGSPGHTGKVLVNQAFAWNPSVAGSKCEETILVGPHTSELLTITGQWPTTTYPGGGRGWDLPNLLSV